MIFEVVLDHVSFVILGFGLLDDALAHLLEVIDVIIAHRLDQFRQSTLIDSGLLEFLDLIIDNYDLVVQDEPYLFDFGFLLYVIELELVDMYFELIERVYRCQLLRIMVIQLE